MEPTAELLKIPALYGTPKEPLAWSAVTEELVTARQYWLTTIRPNGRPHAVPLDGIWVDDAWYYGGTGETVHRRNVDANPNVVMHLPDPNKAVIVEGEVRITEPPADRAQRLAEAFNAKYPEYGTREAGFYKQTLALFPSRVLAWMSYPADATRFTFPPEPD